MDPVVILLFAQAETLAASAIAKAMRTMRFPVAFVALLVQIAGMSASLTVMPKKYSVNPNGWLIAAAHD
jgi:hypothetical protein